MWLFFDELRKRQGMIVDRAPALVLRIVTIVVISLIDIDPEPHVPFPYRRIRSLVTITSTSAANTTASNV